MNLLIIDSHRIVQISITITDSVFCDDYRWVIVTILDPVQHPADAPRSDSKPSWSRSIKNRFKPVFWLNYYLNTDMKFKCCNHRLVKVSPMLVNSLVRIPSLSLGIQSKKCVCKRENWCENKRGLYQTSSFAASWFSINHCTSLPCAFYTVGICRLSFLTGFTPQWFNTVRTESVTCVPGRSQIKVENPRNALLRYAYLISLICFLLRERWRKKFSQINWPLNGHGFITFVNELKYSAKNVSSRKRLMCGIRDISRLVLD